MIQNLIPNLKFLNSSIQQICQIAQCDEIILFEKSTFLIIAYYQKTNDTKSISRYERISAIIKLFKISCNKAGADIKSLMIQNPNFEAVIEDFTNNTFILLVSQNKSIKTAALKLNIECARIFFKTNSKMVENLLE